MAPKWIMLEDSSKRRLECGQTHTDASPAKGDHMTAGKDRHHSPNPMSNKSLIPYRLVRREFLLEHPQCQCVIEGHRCRHRSTQIHHKRGRGRNLCNVETFMAVCAGCHDHIERNRSWAKDQGYLINRASEYVLPPNLTPPTPTKPQP
jgi:hypothetical protein